MRARRKGRDLQAVANRTGEIKPGDILLFCVFRNEDVRLPYFLSYYRGLGIDHFIMLDNGSTDEGPAFLLEQSDISLWHTKAPYGEYRYGMDWLTYLQGQNAAGHWILT